MAAMKEEALTLTGEIRFHRGDESAFTLAKPPTAILLSEVLRLADEEDPAERVKSPAALRVVQTLSKARLEAVSGRTLADVLA